jgi:hypothetical protein
MTHRTVGNNRVLRKDESGTYYKDIVFVPSGALSMNNPSSSTTSTTRKEEDVSEIREVHTGTHIYATSSRQLTEHSFHMYESLDNTY